MNTDFPFHLDKQRVRASFNNAAHRNAAERYDEAAVLQREVAARMLERLELIRIQPIVIADIGCGTGIATVKLLNKYRKANIFAVELATNMLIQTRRKTTWRQRLFGISPYYICADSETLPLADNSCDLLFSNLSLQWCNQLDQAFNEFLRILKPNGLLMFSTLGPDTLSELRQSWANADTHTHVNAFIDMHDIGDALLRARFADPVMDAEHFTLTYKTVRDLMSDLKRLGANNANTGRARTLTGKNKLKIMQDSYEKQRSDGVLPATYEIVYGHAWKHEHVQKNEPGVATVPLAQLRRR